MKIIILHILCPIPWSGHAVHQGSFPRPGSLSSPGLPGRLMRTKWQEESLVLAASPVERNPESTKRGRILPSAPIKWVLLRLLGRGRYCHSRVPQPGRRSELPRVLTSLRSWQERSCHKPLSYWVMFWLLSVLDIPDHLELGSCCRRLSLAVASQLSAELSRTSAAGPGVAVI